MNEAARSLTAPIDNNFLSGEKATKPQREQMISPWAEFPAFLQLSLFAWGAWRQSGFATECKESLQNSLAVT